MVPLQVCSFCNTRSAPLVSIRSKLHRSQHCALKRRRCARSEVTDRNEQNPKTIRGNRQNLEAAPRGSLRLRPRYCVNRLTGNVNLLAKKININQIKTMALQIINCNK